MKIFKNIRYKIASLFLLFRVHGDVSGQMTAAGNFEPEINYYRQVDTISQLPENPILFIGSSSIKNWINMDSAFVGYPILNRGFGGSKFEDVINYAEDVILKYDPKQIVIYCGENDFAAVDTISPEIVFSRFVKLISVIRNKYADVPIVYISLKPSPAKINMMHKIIAFNTMVAVYSAQQNNITFANIYSPMLNAEGQPDTSYFFEDKLHMNEKGYSVWNEVVRPLLIE